MSLLSSAIIRGVLSARPTDNTALTKGRLFSASDTNAFYIDNGTGWDQILASAPGPSYFEEVVTFTGTAGALTHTPIVLFLEDNGKVLRKVGSSPEFSIDSTVNITLSYTPGGTHVFVAKYWY